MYLVGIPLSITTMFSIHVTFVVKLETYLMICVWRKPIGGKLILQQPCSMKNGWQVFIVIVVDIFVFVGLREMSKNVVTSRSSFGAHSLHF